MFDPFRKIVELHAQYRSLNIVEQGSFPVIMVFARLAVLAVIAQAAHHARDVWIVGGDRPAVAESPQNFKWEKAQAASQAERSGLAAVKFRAQRLRRIFYNN